MVPKRLFSVTKLSSDSFEVSFSSISVLALLPKSKSKDSLFVVSSNLSELSLSIDSASFSLLFTLSMLSKNGDSIVSVWRIFPSVSSWAKTINSTLNRLSINRLKPHKPITILFFFNFNPSHFY